METESEFYVPEDKVVSLSIDQVDSNPDGLIEMRGEGRYFGTQDPSSENSGPLCANCHQPGHRRANCTTVVCHACGVVDDHYTDRCPKSMACYNCGERGHYGSKCTKKARKLYCQTCESTRHMSGRCPSIWRSYLTKTGGSGRVRTALPTNMYCYNCGDKGHYGDDCPHERNSRLPNVDGSAFSGHNLPQQMREAYMEIQKKRKRSEGGSLMGRVKNVFKKDKKDKKEKREKKDKKLPKNLPSQPKRMQSMPSMRTGYLEPEFSRFDDYREQKYGRNSFNNSYNNGYNGNYGYGQGQSSRRNNSGYNNGHGNGGGGYPRPSRSGRFNR